MTTTAEMTAAEARTDAAEAAWQAANEEACSHMGTDDTGRQTDARRAAEARATAAWEAWQQARRDERAAWRRARSA